MVKYEIWNTEVDLELSRDTFPDDEELKRIDEKLSHPYHGFFDSESGPKLHYRKYVPGTVPVGAVFVWAHGIQSQSGMCCELPDGTHTNMGLLARRMKAAGIALYAGDMAGHGFSEGRRFYIPEGGRWETNRDDLAALAAFASSEHPGVPVFLGGESYGACLALHVARQWQDDAAAAPPTFGGVLLCAPAIIGDLPPPAVVFVLSRILAPLFPTRTPFFMPHPVSPDRIWRNERVRVEFSTGREMQIGLSAGGNPFCLGTAVGLLLALEEVRNSAIPGLTVPFCVQHGTDDWGVPIEGTDFLINNAATPETDRAVRKIEGAYHDLLSDDCKEETADFMVKWINSRI